MKNSFGRYIRAQREELLAIGFTMFGLRQVAAKAGIEPSYLSKIERGRVPPPSDETITRLAKAIGAVPDEVLALAGRIHADVHKAIVKRPKLMAGLIRRFANISDDAVMRVIRRARRTGKQ